MPFIVDLRNDVRTKNHNRLVSSSQILAWNKLAKKLDICSKSGKQRSQFLQNRFSLKCKRIVESRHQFYLSLTIYYLSFYFCKAPFCYLRYLINICAAGNSSGGYGSHSVSQPIILMKIIVNQMLQSSYISSLLVSIF